MKKVSVIIINYNTPKAAKDAILSFKKAEQGLDYEIIFIDNNSKNKVDNEFLKLHADRVIQNFENLGFAKAVNQGIKIAQGEYVLLLNSDIIITERVAGNLAELFDSQKNLAVAGPMVKFPDGRFQASFGPEPTFASEFLRLGQLYRVIPGGTVSNHKSIWKKRLDKTLDVGWVSGCYMFIRKKAAMEIGLFDENYFFGYEDIDICARLRRIGWKVIYEPSLSVFHYHGLSAMSKGSSFRKKMNVDGLKKFFQKFYPKQKIRLMILLIMHYFFK